MMQAADSKVIRNYKNHMREKYDGLAQKSETISSDDLYSKKMLSHQHRANKDGKDRSGLNRTIPLPTVRSLKHINTARNSSNKSIVLFAESRKQSFENTTPQSLMERNGKLGIHRVDLTKNIVKESDPM